MTDEPQKNELVERFLRSLIGKLFLAALFGPFVIAYIFGFLGMGMPGGWYGHWFMGSLTLCGVGSIFFFVPSVKACGIKEMGCIIPIAAATCLWGYIFFRDLGFLK
jgi:hypothetical protein